MSKLDKRIINLEKEKLLLERQITELQNSKEFIQPAMELDHERTKKFIIYGLEEHNKETEKDLHDRMIRVIGEIMNVNIIGYIENIARIGRKGYRRPIMVELISKRMTRYILENSSCFKNTGLAVSEYLDPQSLKERKKLRDILNEHRKMGRFAVIRNNKLYVDGREYPTTNQEKPGREKSYAERLSDNTNTTQHQGQPKPASYTNPDASSSNPQHSFRN
ncbi:hypothetical protein O0L34_g14794 [Tuta absoluta]|nr:hypothetical protein O0L34_g14794 [Tuta absoluta]